MPGVQVIIKGHVQGVYFRASAREKALSLDLKGWVKNNPEGHVELIACGNQENIEKFLNWCRQGPRGAKVTDIQVVAIEAIGFNTFTILH